VTVVREFLGGGASISKLVGEGTEFLGKGGSCGEGPEGGRGRGPGPEERRSLGRGGR